MSRIPAHFAATIAHARIDDLIQSDGPDRRHRTPVLRPAWWTRVTASQLRSIPLT